MSITYTRITIAGQNVLDEINTDRAAAVKQSKLRAGCYDSESLCAHQIKMSQRGYLGAEIVQTLRGWSLRYNSGLQDFGLIVRGIATWDDAVAAAHQWQAADTARRYVTFTQVSA